MFDSVESFLESQVRSRPQTFKEIELNVDKARANCWRELNTLLIRNRVSIIVLRFNNLSCDFYTLRRDVVVSLVRGAVFVEEAADVWVGIPVE